MLIRKTTQADIPRRQEIFDIGRQYQLATGNLHQWKPGYPGMEKLLGDIENGTGYVVEHEGKIVGTFALIYGADPTYAYIEDGAWLSDEPYAAIHRVASDGSIKGLGDYILQWCIRQAGHVRIDTHHDNKTMQHVIEKNGFRYCGVIYIEDGTPRVAYEYIPRENEREADENG